MSRNEVIMHDDEKLAISIPEAGRRLGIGRGLSYEAARTGEIPTIRSGNRLLVPIQALKETLAASSSTPSDTAEV